MIHGRLLHIRHLWMEQAKARQRQALVLVRTSTVGRSLSTTRQVPELHVHSLKASWRSLRNATLVAGMYATNHSQLEDQIVVPHVVALVETAPCQLFRSD